MIVYEEWVVEDVTASAFEEPLAANQEVNMSLPSLSTPTIIFLVFTTPASHVYSYSQLLFTEFHHRKD
jgi:hypothetical protein